MAIAQEIKRDLGWDYGGFWRRYDAYLLSDEWRMRRRQIFERDSYRCKKCGEAPAAQVHHETYARVGNELDEDLISVCIPCHRKLHPNRKFAAFGDLNPND